MVKLSDQQYAQIREKPQLIFQAKGDECTITVVPAEESTWNDSTDPGERKEESLIEQKTRESTEKQ